MALPLSLSHQELDASKSHPKCLKPWSVKLAKKFNSHSFVVRTMALGDLHHAFVKSLTIKLEDCPGEVTPEEEVERRVAESQTTLKKIIMKWEISGRGDGEQTTTMRVMMSQGRRAKLALDCTMLKVGMKVLSDNNCELLVLDKSDKKQGS
jgi:hypothetical protein